MTFDSVRASDLDNPTSPDWFPLTAAQMGIWNAQSLDPSSPYYVVGEVMELDPTDSQPDISVADVVQALHQTIAEAETLRLQFRQGDATDIRADDSAGEDAGAVRADDSPRQRAIDVAPGQYVTIPIHDLRAHPAPEAAANAYVDAAKARCAEAWAGLVDRPLCHFEVLRLDRRRVWIIQLYHHLIVDGYASMILARRTTAHYTELTGGKKARPAKFSALTSVVKEDREYHESDNRDRDAQWWQESLAGVGSTQWRDELIGGSESSSRTTVLTVDADELDAWKATSQHHGTTWVDSLLAAYAVYLRRVQGVEADELVVAMPFAARETAAQRRTPAMMVNMLPVRLPIDLTATLPDNAHAVEETMRTVREHQRFPGSEVATTYGDSSILRGIGANLKVFDAALTFGKTRGYLRNVAGGPPENLVLVAAPGRSGGVDLSFETVADIPPQVVHQRLSDIRAVVNAGLGLDRRSECAGASGDSRGGRDDSRDGNAESSLPASSDIRIRPERIPAELREEWDGELLSDGSSGDPSRGSIESLDSLIDLLAQRWGDRVLLADGSLEYSETSPSSTGATYTGAELVKQCDQLADSIASVCPEGGVVAIDMPKNAAQAIAVLASLRAHRPFVVIDDDAPQDRRSFIMKDSAAAAVVTGLDNVQPVERDDNEQTPPHEPDDLAYIVYTSGTTGRPKGVNVTRRAVEHLIAGHRAQLFPETLDHVANTQPQASASLAHTASFAFDAAIDQLSWIFAGVRVVIYNRSTVADGEAFHRCLRRDNITMIDATPSLFGALLASGVPLLDARKSQIRAVLLGGEPMPQQLWDQVAAASHIIGWNMYGPSEATVDALSARITPGAVTVGWPVPGMSLRICDASGEIVPPGEEGELWLMGEQITQGYRNNPDATAHAFFRADATASRPRADVTADGSDGHVLVPAYRTGDRVRWVPGRGVALIGRADNQIEVRGHRVELEEIDGALAVLPGVRAAGTIAVARGVGDASRPEGDNSVSTGDGHAHVGAASVNIRAGIVLEGVAGHTPASNKKSDDPQANTDDITQRLSELRQHLSRILPDYMVPSTLVAVPQIPRTSTEKIDRRALRELIEQSAMSNDRAAEHQGSGDHQGSGADLRAPETPRELAVSRVIQDVMGQSADLDVDFINQGGDSITALVVAGRLQQQGFDIRPADILSGRPLGEIAASLRRSSSAATDNAASSVTSHIPATSTDGHINPEPQPNILTDFGVVDAPSGMDRSAFTGPNQPVMSVVIPCAPDMEADDCRACATRLAEDVPALRSIATWDADTAGSEQFIIRRHPAEDEDFRAPVDLAEGRSFALELVDGGVRLSVHSAVVDADGFAQLIGIVEVLLQRAGHGDGHSDGRQHRYASWRGHSAPALPWAHSRGRATAMIEPSVAKALLSNLGTKFVLSDQDILTAAALMASASDPDETLTAMVLSRALRQPSAPASGQAMTSGNVVARDVVGRFAAPGYVTASPSDSWAETETILLSVKEQRAELRSTHDTNPTDTSAKTPAITLELGHIPSLAVVNSATSGLPSQHNTLIPTHHPLRPGFPDVPHITAWVTGTGTGIDTNTPDHPTAPVGNEPGQQSLSITVDAETDDRAQQLADSVVTALTDLAVFGLSAEGSASPSDCLAPVTSADIEHWQRRFGPLQNVYGLSPLQEGLLYQALDSRERDHYVIAASMAVEGPADPELLRASFEAVMRRQDVLKAAFDYETLDRPVHVIPRTPRWQWSVIDARGLPSRVQSSLIDDVLGRMASRQLDVTRGNMVAATLVKLGDRRSQLVLGNHHILTDGWSTTILLRELMHVYNRAAELLPSGNGGDVEDTISRAIASAIAELPPRYPYGQFVEDMQPRVKADTELWIDHVAGLDHTSRVMDALTPAAEPDASMTDEVSGEEHCIVQLSDQQKADLSRCARTVGVTPNTLIQTAWACVVAALTGHDDAVFGVVTSGRPSELDGIDNTIGLFINTLPVRVDLRGDSLLSILRSHARAQAELADHTCASLADIERRAGESGGGDPLSGPLFDSLVVYDNFPDEFSEIDTQSGALPDSDDRAATSRGIRITGLTTRGETQYPLTVIHPPGGPFDLALAYQPGVVSQQVADTLADALRATLSRCASIADVESPESLRAIRDEIAPMLDNIRRRPGQNADDRSIQDHDDEPTSELPTSEPTTSNQPNAETERPDQESQLLRDICEDIAGLLNRPTVDPDVAFEDLGVHSLMAVRLMGKLRKRGHKLDIQTIVEAGSPSGIVRAIEDDSPQPPASRPATSQETQPQTTQPTDACDHDSRPPWMVTLKEGKGRPLFCFHAIDGSVFSYQGLAEYLTTDRPIIGIQFPANIPGRISWDKAVDLYASAIRDYQPEGPYTFVGFSFGATIAHAVSARLNQQRDTAAGPVVDLLVVLDAYPARAGMTPPPIPDDLNVDLLSDITGFSAHDLRADGTLRDRSERSVRACARWMGEVSDTPVRGVVKKVVLITAEKAPIVRNTSGVVERPKPDQQTKWNPAEAWENTGVELRTHSLPLDHGGLASLAGWKQSAPTLGEELE